MPAIASGNWNALGDWDASEPPFSEDEIERALELRQRVWPDPRLARRDRCPHAEMCSAVGECIEKIAWYLRHQHAIEAGLVSA